MNFVEVASTGDLSVGQMKNVMANGHELLLANIAGEYYAMAKKCPHMGADLCSGKLDGHAVVCPRHGATFDVKTGQPLRGPKIFFMSLKVKDAKTFPTKVANGKVLVGI